ncbi:MAG: ABC transporter ATP-binding protein [Pseudomonadota bacterium]
MRLTQHAALPNDALSSDPASPAILALDDVRLTLPASGGPVDILKGVSLSVAPGETLSVVGPSGSGKSSLISVAAGLERPSGGTVRLLDRVINDEDEDALARLRRGRVTLVFQSFHLLGAMTALDNVRVPMEIARVDDAEDRARDALDAVDLSDRLTHYPNQLSGGERQRVAVARALAPNPTLVFADEPTGNLDTASGAVVADLLFAIAKERGAGLVLVTHDGALAARADRTVAMRDGRLA